MTGDINSLLYPKSIAIIGVSEEKDKLGRIIFDNIVEGDFDGKIYPVNLKSIKIGKFTTLKNITEIKGFLDVVIIAIPAQFVTSVIEEIVARGSVGNVIIISAGFSESGDDGFELEYKIKKTLESKNIRLLGPNCLGIISTFCSLNATFGKYKIKKGGIAFVSQSGALGTAALDLTSSFDIGISHFVSLGNKSDLNENDFLEVFEQDEKVSLITLYLEDFADGANFIKIAKKCSKPIVILKPGISKEAQKALGSHTGSIAQSDKIISAALKQGKVTRVFSIEDLFNIMSFYSQDKHLKGNNIAIVTNAGGPGVIATDHLMLSNLKLTQLEMSTKKQLRLTLPRAASVSNPVDVLGDARSDRFESTLKIIEKDKNVDGIIILLTPQVMTEVEKTAQVIVSVSKNSNKIFAACFIGADLVQKGINILKSNHIPTFNFPNDAVSTFSNIYSYGNLHKQKETESSIYINYGSDVKTKAAQLLQDKKWVVEASVVEKVLKLYKIPLVPAFYPVDIADARRLCTKTKFPLVLKLIHPSLLHKTDKKAVLLDIKDMNELEEAFAQLIDLAENEKLEDYKIQLQPFIKASLELFVGVKKDEDVYKDLGEKKVVVKKGFGHTLVFGGGGIYSEIYNDMSLKILPMSGQNIDEIVNETKVGNILFGSRGIKYNVRKIKELIRSVVNLVTDFDQIMELDINPIMLKGDEVYAADVKMIVEL